MGANFEIVAQSATRVGASEPGGREGSNSLDYAIEAEDSQGGALARGAWTSLGPISIIHGAEQRFVECLKATMADGDSRLNQDEGGV